MKQFSKRLKERVQKKKRVHTVDTSTVLRRFLQIRLYYKLKKAAEAIWQYIQGTGF